MQTAGTILSLPVLERPLFSTMVLCHCLALCFLLAAQEQEPYQLPLLFTEMHTLRQSPRSCDLRPMEDAL